MNGEKSEWQEDKSGVPQVSLLGPVLFSIYINDIDLIVELITLLIKFADDTKAANIIRSQEDQRVLQECLDALMAWAAKWGMAFNAAKCKVMHVGRRNPRFQYTMGEHILETTERERDIGMLVNSNLKPSDQCRAAARTAQAVLGQLTRAFHYRDRHVFMRLYKQYVRPHLEFCTQAWAPWYEEDKNCLEKVQQRAIAMVSGLRGRGYEERLAELGLTTLEERRHQADMAMVHRIVHGQSGLEPETWFEMAGARRNTRSAADPLNILVKTGRLDVRRNFFTIRVIERWNAIPAEMKAMENTARFRARYMQLRAQTLSAS